MRGNGLTDKAQLLLKGTQHCRAEVLTGHVCRRRQGPQQWQGEGLVPARGMRRRACAGTSPRPSTVNQRWPMRPRKRRQSQSTQGSLEKPRRHEQKSCSVTRRKRGFPTTATCTFSMHGMSVTCRPCSVTQKICDRGKQGPVQSTRVASAERSAASVKACVVCTFRHMCSQRLTPLPGMRPGVNLRTRAVRREECNMQSTNAHHTNAACNGRHATCSVQQTTTRHC